MPTQWLWLEDEEETVLDFRREVEKSSEVHWFHRIPTLTRYLLNIRERAQMKDLKIGFILDVMISSAHAVTRPRSWLGDSKEATFFTDYGYEAGFVFYERLILDGDTAEKTLLFPPPPVVFLSIMKESPGFEVRLAAIKRRWANAHHLENSEDAKVLWLRKWDEDGAIRLASILQKWTDE